MLEKIVVISFIVYAVYATMKEGMIFGFVQKWWDKFTENWGKENADYWSKPIISCPICQVPYYGSVAYWLIYGNNWQEWIIVIIAAMGLNAIIVELSPDKD